MNTEQVRERLLAERARLLEVRDAATRLSTSATEAAQRELTPVDQHPAEQATETLERVLDLGDIQSVEAELSALQVPLDLLDAVKYVVCEFCCKPIAEARL